MSDEDYDEAFDIEYIDHDTAQAAVQWSYEAATLIFLIRNGEEPGTVENALVRLEQILDGLEFLVDLMPDHLARSGEALAAESEAKHAEAETLVEKFRKEIEAL